MERGSTEWVSWHRCIKWIDNATASNEAGNSQGQIVCVIKANSGEGSVHDNCWDSPQEQHAIAT
jgi:hypothetical protein